MCILGIHTEISTAFSSHSLCPVGKYPLTPGCSKPVHLGHWGSDIKDLIRKPPRSDLDVPGEHLRSEHWLASENRTPTLKTCDTPSISAVHHSMDFWMLSCTCEFRAVSSLCVKKNALPSLPLHPPLCVDALFRNAGEILTFPKEVLLCYLGLWLEYHVLGEDGSVCSDFLTNSFRRNPTQEKEAFSLTDQEELHSFAAPGTRFL